MTSEHDKTILGRLGWNDHFERHFQSTDLPASVPGRVVSQNRHLYQVFTGAGVLQAQVSGRLRRQAEAGVNYPVVGDWVVLTLKPGEEGTIHAVLPRISYFSRQASGARGRLAGGETKEQVVAANIDTAFIIAALDEGRSTNIRRFERYLTLVRASGADPVIVLNKSDLCADVESYIRAIQPAVAGIPVYAVSAKQKTGLDALRQYITAAKTVAFLGPSGVGKSALINSLLGTERQATGEVRDRDRTGRHTTTSRELILLPAGGIVIDTPGMREIQMWADDADLEQSFEDIESLAEQCRFGNCTHNKEPGCAVRAAVESGVIDPGRVESFRKLQREVRYHEARETDNDRRLEKAKWKKISQGQKNRGDL